MADSVTRPTVKIAVLVGCLVLSVASVGFAISGPASSSPYTEFSILSPDGDRLVADDYPTVGDDDGTVVVRVTNHERSTAAYTLVVAAERLDIADGSGLSVRESREVSRTTLELSDGESTTERVDVLALGDLSDDPNVRVAFWLFRGDAPADADGAGAYRSLHLWVNHTAPDAS